MGANDNRSWNASRSLLTPVAFSGIHPRPRRAPLLRLQPVRIASHTTSQLGKQCGDCGGYIFFGGGKYPPKKTALQQKLPSLPPSKKPTLPPPPARLLARKSAP